MAYQAEKELQEILGRIHKTAGSATNSAQIQPLLARAKINLLQLNALIPARDTPEKHLKLARDVFEAGAFVCIKFPDAEGFTRYFQQLQPFYDLPEEMLSHEGANKSRITGLYLLLLLSQGDTSGFHTMLERLINAAYAAEKNGTGKPLEDDEFIQYPRKLEEALSEGTYDRAWNMTMVEKVPGPEFAVFSDILRDTIRSEIASCAEVAYKNLSVRGAKNVLKLDSEGAVVKFAENRGWIIKDEHVYFPTKEADLQASERDNTSASRTIIENMLSYARQLENIV
ncbi:hypothetical protein M501DRAFT_941576 [Patellaria atrata CBS 101060]|uniref:PCI domain-containing protein n=1 Tax=Patellaria atrata CBS 101060 TaxID=1346257 RepID=A0A9P4VPM5_9PEZI|nr:hypothetical protein M501DRAFT_941576 [Patellaria atrata CBS 101060]